MHDGNQFLFSVARVESTFEDGLNKPRSGSASGFFVLGQNGHAYLVTNKHNVDPSLKLGSTNHRLTRLAIEVRRFAGGFAQAETFVVELPLDGRRLVQHATSDVSVYDTNNVPLPGGFAIAAWAQQDSLADATMHSHLQAMDLVSFIGFPGGSGAPWLDDKWRTPIARLASLASVPAVPFSHKHIGTSDVTLVNGLSFHGSSGSMVVSHPRDQSVLGRNAISTKIVGIMSGAWRERDSDVAKADDPFGPHSGVSYYTRSTSILEVLHQAMAAK